MRKRLQLTSRTDRPNTHTHSTQDLLNSNISHTGEKANTKSNIGLLEREGGRGEVRSS